jgi:hypothetical protein
VTWQPAGMTLLVWASRVQGEKVRLSPGRYFAQYRPIFAPRVLGRYRAKLGVARVETSGGLPVTQAYKAI